MTEHYIELKKLKGEMRKRKLREFAAKMKAKSSAALQTAQRYAQKGREYQLKAKEKARGYVQSVNRGVENVRKYAPKPAPYKSKPSKSSGFCSFTPPSMEILPSFSGRKLKQQDMLPLFDNPKHKKGKRRKQKGIFDFNF